MLFGVVGLFLASLAWTNLDGLLDRQNSAAYDDLTWNITQVHLEHLRFVNALQDALLAGEDDEIASVRLRFDILYSRLNVFQGTQIQQLLAEESVSAEAYDALEDAVMTTVPVIDGPDSALRAALPMLVSRFRALDDAIRDFTVQGNVTLGLIAERTRHDIAASLWRTMVLTIPIFLSLLILLVQGFLLNRTLMRRVRDLDRLSHHLNDIFNASLDSIVAFDLRGQILFANESVSHTFGVGKETVVGQDLSRWFADAATRESFIAGCATYAKTGHSWLSGADRLVIDLLDQTGDARTFECAILPVKDMWQKRYFVAFMRDISSMIKAKRDVANALVLARAGEEAQRRMVSVLGHELRSPLNAVSGYLHFCLEAVPDDCTMRSRLEAADTVLDRAVRIANNALDYGSMPVSGGQSSVSEVMYLGTKVAALVERHRRFADTRGIGLKFHLEQSDDIRIVCDPHILSIALSNVVHNAVAHTARGEVQVTVSTETMDENRVRARLEIADTGPGISTEDQARIFDNFETLQAVSERTERGAGLGLGLVSRSMSVLEGEIELRSTPGQGTTIVLAFPATLAVAADSSRAHLAPGPRRILIVEDNDDNMEVMTSMLAELGYQADCAYSGEAAISLARSTPYDLILMDIAMTGINGIQAAERIRDVGASASARIVAVTAYSHAELRQECLVAGMFQVMTKPVSKADLAALLCVPEESSSTAKPLCEALEGGQCQVPDFASSEQVSLLIDSLGIDRVRALFKRFVAELEKTIARAEHGGDREIASELHKVAGSAAVFGLLDLRNALLAAEATAVDDDHGGLARSLPDLHAATARVREDYSALLQADCRAAPKG